MQVAMLVPEAAKLKKKRWAIVYPNYEYGQSAAATFKTLLKAAQPDVEFVAEQAPPLGKLDAGSVVQALADAKPDAIFNVLFGADLARSCARATRAACSRARGGQPADRRARVPGSAEGRDARTAGSSPATPGTASRRPSTRPSSWPTTASSTTTRAWARWWATAAIKSLAAGITKAKRHRHRKADHRLPPGWS
jgi:ABC-type branched-subunit amino acid transport system substrate-binding protein